jgi:hypothetical protein
MAAKLGLGALLLLEAAGSRGVGALPLGGIIMST